MLLITHIIIAFASIALASYNLLSPSKLRLSSSYALIAGTLGTGIALAINNPAQILHLCASGVVYLSIVTVLTLTARKTASANI